ncbi:MAG: tetratricopeptide repeat protein [Planctomycetes bacterium]|nr:tetratricopeptide repeat protein [Planctomycetota bacterium]
MRKTHLALFVAVAALAGLVAARPWADPLEDAEEALKDRDYKKAVELFTKAHDGAKEGRDRILYLLATACQHAGRFDDGIAACDRLLREHPNSVWVYKTHFKKGDLLAAKKEHELAARLAEERVRAVASPERRKAIATIYVEAAREFLVPKEKDDPSFVPNYVAAQRLLVKSLELESLGADEESVRFDIVTCEFRGNFDRNQLLRSCDAFFEKFAKSAKLDEAGLIRGRALAQLGRWWEARKAWATVVADHPKSAHAPTALWETAAIEPGPRGLAALREIVAKYPAAEIAPQAAMTLADRLSANEDLWPAAIAAYRDVAAKFPRDERAPNAAIRAAELEVADDRIDDAIASYDAFLKTFTESPRWGEVRQRICDLRFVKGWRAFLRKDFAAARKLFDEFVAAYPTDGRGAQIALTLGDMLREEKKLKDAVDQFRRVAARWPNTGEGNRARLSAGEILEELDDFDAAIQEYTKGGHHGKVQELRGKSLYVESERVFPTNEAPAATMTCRNFTKVHLRLWTLDLKDYFEKKGSTAGLNSVEVSVIAPDQEWDFEVKDFKRFKKHRVPVALPVKGAGAFIVQAKAENLESVTVVLVSDLAFIAKAGRKGVTLLGQDMKRNEGLDTIKFGASADGRPVKDGRAFPPEICPSRISVLAEVLGNFAFRDFDVSGMQVPLQRRPVALLLPDRGIYAPRDAATLRIVVRDVADNAWIVPKDKTYRLTATSHYGIVLFERTLKLSAQGTATETLDLFDGLANVRFDVHEIAKPVPILIGQTGIAVGHVPGRAARFDFLMEDRTYFFGEDVEIGVALRDAVGRPIRNRAFRYHVSGLPDWKEAKTDGDGVFALKLAETEQFERTGCLIQTQFGDLRDAHAIAFVPRGFRIDLDPSVRPLEPALAGEPRTIKLATKDHANNPVPQKLEWQVRRTNGAGEKIVVASGEVGTDPKGIGSFSFTPTAGGVHTVLVRGFDSQHQPVRTSTAVAVSDDKDPVTLRILSEKDEFVAGEPVAVTAHSRLDRIPAYVVVESERIEWTKRITLEKGRNAIPLDLGGRYLRNFRVSVLALQGNKFHSVVRDFRMKRAADVEIVLDKETYRPGDEVKVVVKAGRTGEIWLQVAEHVMTWINPDQIDPVLPGPYFVTDASNTVSFQGQTTQVSRELEDALARLDDMDRNNNARVNMDPRAERQWEKRKAADKDHADEDGQGYLQFRGGGGGEYGRRMGGKRLIVHGTAHPRPIFLGTAATNAKGEATFAFRLPLENAQYTVRAYVVDGSNAVSTASKELKARSPISVEIWAPEAIREGDRAMAAVFVSNSSAKAVTTELGPVPARSVAEFLVPAAAKFSVKVDGLEYVREIAIRPVAPLRTAVAAGRTFSIGPEGATPVELRVDVAGTPEEELLLLARGGDAFTAEADLAARLLALALAKSPEAKEASLRLLHAPRPYDLPTEVIRYLALAVHDPEHKPDASYLKQMFSQASSDDQKALILFALSRTGDANFAYVNRLARSAETLSPRAALLTALLLHAADRKDEAKTLFAKVKSEEPAKLSVADWSNTPSAIRAILAVAAAEIDPSRSVSIGERPPVNAFERAMHALVVVKWPTKARQPSDLKVNGRPTEPGLIPAGFLVKGAQKIEFTGVRATAHLVYASEAREPAVKTAVKRTFQWPAVEAEGQALATGLVVSSGESKMPPSMKRTAAGAPFAAVFEYTFTGGETDMVVIEESLPAGLHVASVAVEGFWQYRLEPGRLRLLLARGKGEQKAKVTIGFVAAAPGEFRGAPVHVRTLADADFAHAAAPEVFTVLGAGENYREGYELQPGELYQLGKLYFDKKDWKKAKEPLARLFERHTLLDNYAIEVARMLAYVSIELGENDGTVRYFEILKEKLPAEVVPFDKILAVGRAYAALKEFDRARQVFLGTCDAYFLQEANVVGELEALGRTKQAAETMRALLRAHPDTDLNREMRIGMAQQLLDRARGMQEVDRDPRRLTRRETLTAAAEILQEYPALYPADAACDQASLVLGTTYLEALDHAKAEATGRSAARRYPKSRFLDSFDYVQAYALFAQKKYAEALAMCDRMETFEYGKQSNPGPEAMKALATLMKAQIYHAKGDLEKAVAAYKAVKDKFSDAARALAFLEREAISIPEVTVVPTNKPNEIEIEASGVPEVHVKAYRMNLTMLFLKYRGVRDAGAIEIAGIRPAFEKTYKLQATGAKRKEKHTLALDVKDVGAYLVSVKAGDFFASGLFLKSDISMSVQEEAQSGTVRVNVANAAGGKFEENVKVTFIGSADQGFKSEKTDLRGIAEAAGLKGFAMVIAEKENHFAFFRGTTALLGYKPEPQKQEDAKKEKDALDDRLKELDENKSRYGQNLQKKQSGVEVERTKK